MLRSYYMTVCIIIVSMLMVFSCTGNRQVKAPRIIKTVNPLAQLDSFEKELTSARQQQFNVLSPIAFAKAEGSYEKAKKEIADGGAITEISANIASGRQTLHTAAENARLARTVLSEVIESRAMAQAAGATQFGSEYTKAEEAFLMLTRAVETNNVNWAKKNQVRTSQQFRELELRAIKEQILGEVRHLLESAERAGAMIIVPVSYAIAKKELENADSFISKQRYSTDEIKKKADNALFMTKRMNQIMQLSEKIKRMKPEQISIYIEGLLRKITKKLSAPDMRDESVEIQVDNILGSISSLQSDYEFMVSKTEQQKGEINALISKHKDEINSLNNKIAQLEGKTREEQAEKDRIEAEKRAVEQRLAAERQFNQLYNEVQDFFEEDEAEVYKHGYELVIRLKDMKFPVGKSVIMPENYHLLSKVQRSIRTFGEPDVTIEGHTDSTGEDVKNEVLSQDRAKAVREYLVANHTLPQEKIMAVGYGSKKPLASNATPEGRAINRRIDVIIKPQIKKYAGGMLSY